MNKAYRLLKDLPGIKAGVIVHGRTPYTFCPSGGGKCFTFGEDEMIKNHDWFEEVKDEKVSNSNKFRKGDLLTAENVGLCVVYTGRGESKDEFSGVVIASECPCPHKIGDYSSLWQRSFFKRKAQ